MHSAGGGASSGASSSAAGAGDLLSTIIGLRRRWGPTQVITITATGRRSEPTSIARVALSVQGRGQTPDAAQAACAKRASQLQEALQARNEVIGVRCLPMRVVANSACCAMVIDAPISDGRDVANHALRCGASQVLHFATLAEEGAVVRARRLASEHALRVARSRADGVASANEKLVRSSNVVHTGSDIQFPTKASEDIPVKRWVDNDGSGGIELSDRIPVGQHVVTATAQVQFVLQ